MCYHVTTVSNGNYPYVLSLFQMKKMSICITRYDHFKCLRPYTYNHACYHSVKLNMSKYNHCLNLNKIHMCNNTITDPDECCPVCNHASFEVAFNILNLRSQIRHSNHGFIWILPTCVIVQVLKLLFNIKFCSQKWHWNYGFKWHLST